MAISDAESERFTAIARLHLQALADEFGETVPNPNQALGHAFVAVLSAIGSYFTDAQTKRDMLGAMLVVADALKKENPR